MFRETIQNTAHAHGNTNLGNSGVKHHGTVRSRKDCFCNILSNFAFVDVECGRDFNIGGFISTDLPVHDPDGVVDTLTLVIMDALNQRTGTVPDSDYGNLYFVFQFSS